MNNNNIIDDKMYVTLWRAWESNNHKIEHFNHVMTLLHGMQEELKTDSNIEDLHELFTFLFLLEFVCEAFCRIFSLLVSKFVEWKHNRTLNNQEYPVWSDQPTCRCSSFKVKFNWCAFVDSRDLVKIDFYSR